MMETKALDNALGIVLNNDVLFASYGGAFKDAAVELAALRAELESETKWAGDYSAQVEKLTHENAALKARLEEAEKVIARVANFAKWIPEKQPDEEFTTVNAGIVRSARAFLA